MRSEPINARRDAAPPSAVAHRAQASQRPLKNLWRRIRKPLAGSRLVKNAVASLLANALRFVYWTNPPREGSADVEKLSAQLSPGIVALWHGQHLLAPFAAPSKPPLVVMVSRSADAELNALVIEKLGISTVRGSGGRPGVGANHFDKGGARALIALKRALDNGMNVGMIADIPHGTPREAGMGIILLAKLSGKPIGPVAVATSRRKVLERTWDRTTIGLPFGRRAVVLGDLVRVPSDADDVLLEAKRRELTEKLNAATQRAYSLADGRP